MTFPALDALRETYGVYQADAEPIACVVLAFVELQRDSACEKTVADVIEIVLTQRLLEE